MSPTTPFEEPRLDIRLAAPRLHAALVALGNDVQLDGRLRELVNVRASILNGCAYCIALHTKAARDAGESEQRLFALAGWPEAPFFDDRERAALALTDAVTLVAEGHVPRDVWENAVEHFESAELAQLIWAITVINAWNRIAITTRMRPGT